MIARAHARYAGCLAAIVPRDSEACSWNPGSVAAQVKAWDQKGDVFGGRAVESIPEVDHTGPVEIKGELLNGTPWATTSARDEMFVLRIWGSCGHPASPRALACNGIGRDCRQRTPACSSCADFREEPARGAAFTANAGITNSILRDESAVLILELQGKAPTVHTTFMLDRGRLCATRDNGPVSATTLRGLVDDVFAAS